jgi:large subunit ribosomal protein L21
MDFAVIKTGGKQYRIKEGDSLTIERLAAGADGKIVFNEVLLKSEGDKVTVGAPHIAGATVEAKLIEDFKDKTKIILKYHSKTRQHKKKGHRQPHTQVRIVKI